MIRSMRFLTFAAATLVAGASAVSAQTKESITWNDPPAKTPAAAAPTAPAGTSASKAPIRDDYSPVTPPKPLVPPQTARSGDQQITWSEPSMPSKGAVGKSNTSASAAGPCRKFQQDIVIDGRKEKAHGRVCQQSDGSWRLQN